MAFVLDISDGNTTVDFMADATNVQDGGFNIGLIKRERSWGSRRGYFAGKQVVSVVEENREAQVRFRLKGTKSEVLQKISDINTVLRNARQRYIRGHGNRVELRYQWDGTSNITYFEIYDGELTPPEDILSVGKIHQSDLVGIYDAKLRLVISPYGYKISPRSGSPIALPISNGNGSNVTSGLDVYNPWDSNPNDYFEIAGSDVPGDGPGILKTEFVINKEASSGVTLVRTYLGHTLKNTAGVQTSYELEDADSLQNCTIESSTGASGGQYIQHQEGITGSGGTNNMASFSIDPDSVSGTFRVLLWAFGPYAYASSHLLMSVRVEPYQTEFKKPSEGSIVITDLGEVTIPYGNLDGLPGLNNVNLVVRSKNEDGEVINGADFDMITLLPVDQGFRVIPIRAQSGVTFDPNGFGHLFVDDGWEDRVYYDNGSGKSSHAYGLLPNLRLEPGEDQRIYLTGVTNHPNGQDDLYYTVKAWVVPTYETMAV